jgi:SAM-dependent methyltransferase
MIERYSLEKASDEAERMTSAIRSGEAKSCSDAASLVFWETEKKFNAPLTEEQLERAAGHILRRLGLSADDLRNKKILDIGAGERYIAAYCQLEGISGEVYSAEPNREHEHYASSRDLDNWPEVKEHIDRRTVKDKRSALSFDDGTFDLVINHFAMPSYTESLKKGDIESINTAVDRIFNEAVRVLKSGGEARLFPIETCRGDKSQTEFFKPSDDAIAEKLNQLVRDGICTVTLEETEDQYPKTNPDKPKLHRIVIRKN